MNLFRNPGRLALLLTLITWTYFLIDLPTFDFDESLYRRVTESMRASGNPWLLSWDGKDLFHKPPVFYWLMWLMSSVVDYGKIGVSALASRLPSFLSSISILGSLYFGMRFLFPEIKKEKVLLSPLFAYLTAGFAILTGTAVILDPLQTLALIPALFIPTQLFLREEIPSRRKWLILGASLAGATLIKGLNGIVIPTFAFGVHLLLHFRAWGLKKLIRTGFQFLIWAFMPAILFAGAAFYLFHEKIGSGFTQEFFLVQHFGRGTNSMEAHGGSPFYHLLVVALGGGFLTPLLVYLAYDRRPSILRLGYPLTYALSFILIFSFSATKLPHYTWPVWPALALFAGLMMSAPASNPPRLLHRRVGFLATFPVLLIGTVLLLLAIAPEALIKAASTDPIARALLSHLEPFGYFQKFCFFVGSTFCWTFQIRRSSIARSPELTAVFASVVFAALAFGIAPSAKKLGVQPFFEIAESLKTLRPAPSDCIQYSGPLSATLSLALAPELLHNRCGSNPVRFQITPEWKEAFCDPAHFKKITQKSYLILCEKNP
jgi:4-amino-4-deoxy-L-arabinose transferase-like glycosyltransferase